MLSSCKGRWVKHSVSSYMYMCPVAQGQLISFLKLLLSSCEDNRVEHWVSYSLLRHLRKKLWIIFLIKLVFGEHANKKEKYITAMYCKSNSTKRYNEYLKLLLSCKHSWMGHLVSRLHISCYIIVTQRITIIVLINTIFLPLCKQKLYIIAIFCIGSSSVLLVIQYFYQFFN